MDLQMTGKKAIVTGASEGIGKAITWAFAREGVDVAICARRKEPLEAVAAEISRATNRQIVPITADLTKPADAENFVKKAHAALGRIDILVNNAGSSPGGVIEHLTEEDWAQSLQLKFMGYVRCMKHVLPIMQKQKKGRVVNLIGNDGVKVSYWEIAPGAANAAGQNLTMSLASQYGKDNISFVCRQSRPGADRALGWPGQGDGARHEAQLRGSRQAGAVEHSARTHRRVRGGRQPRHLPRFRPRLLRQWHDD